MSYPALWPRRFRGIRKLARVGLCLAVPLGGCGKTDRIVASSAPLDDYRARHPIVLAEARTSIDLFPAMTHQRLDAHTAKQIYAFTEQYREAGHGPMLMLLPRGRAFESGAVVTDVRRVLAAGGVHEVEVSTYPVANPALASPVRLSFGGLKAKVADQCGQWPNDLGSGSSIAGWENRPYWNFGCATQSMIAAQTSDPRDLVTPRGEEAADTGMRQRAIVTVRKGLDPSTEWRVKATTFGTTSGGP